LTDNTAPECDNNDNTGDAPSFAELILVRQMACLLYPAHDSRSDNNSNIENDILQTDLIDAATSLAD